MHFHGADTGAAGEKEQVNWAGETIGGPESPPLPFPPVCASVRATAPSKAGTGPEAQERCSHAPPQGTRESVACASRGGGGLFCPQPGGSRGHLPSRQTGQGALPAVPSSWEAGPRGTWLGVQRCHLGAGHFEEPSLNKQC